MPRTHLRPSVISIVIALTLVSLALYLLSSSSDAQQPADPGDPQVTFELEDGDPTKVVRPRLPEPDPSRAASLHDGVSALRTVPGIEEIFLAVQSRDVGDLLSLTVVVQLDCATLGRAAGALCKHEGETDGSVRAVTIEDGGSRYLMAEAQARRLLEAIMAAGEPSALLATHDRRTPVGSGGTYYIAFGVPEFDASYVYAEGLIGTGLALKVTAGSEVPIVEISMLSSTWNALKWLQLNDAVHQTLLFPENLDGYERVYDLIGADNP